MPGVDKSTIVEPLLSASINSKQLHIGLRHVLPEYICPPSSTAAHCTKNIKDAKGVPDLLPRFTSIQMSSNSCTARVLLDPLSLAEVNAKAWPYFLARAYKTEESHACTCNVKHFCLVPWWIPNSELWFPGVKVDHIVHKGRTSDIQCYEMQIKKSELPVKSNQDSGVPAKQRVRISTVCMQLEKHLEW